MPLTVDWSVSINGTDYSFRFNPYVMEIEVTDGSGSGSDSCRITLADDGRIILPRKGAEISVSIMGVQVFTGILKTPRCTLAKGQGGIMQLNAAGHDTEGKGKEGQNFAMEETTLGAFLEAMGKRAGYTVKVDPELAKLGQPWIGSEGRSFHHMAQKLADQYGGTVKLSNKRAVFAKRGQGKTPGGNQLPTVRVTNPGNLISSDMEPFDASEAYRDARLIRFDRKGAKFEKVDIRPGPTAQGAASKLMRGRSSSQEDAKDRATGRANSAERDRGGGTVEIDIEPQARAEGTCILAGVRQGIDGEYRIESVTHTLRAGDGGGATSKLTLKQPGDEAGSDKRKAGDTE